MRLDYFPDGIPKRIHSLSIGEHLKMKRQSERP